MAAEVRKPVLNLDTLIERRTVAVDGEHYDLMNVAELSILDYHRIGKQGERVQELMAQKEDLNEEQIQVLSELVDAMCKVLLRAPDDIHERLRDNQRLAVINVFTELSQPKKTEAPPAGDEKQPPLTGESTSPD